MLGFSAPAMAMDYPVSGQGTVYVSNEDYSVDEAEAFCYTQTDAETFVIANFLNSGVDVTLNANFSNGSVTLQGGEMLWGYWYLTDANGIYPAISCGSYNGSFFSTYADGSYTYAGYYDGYGYYVNFNGYFGYGDDDWFYATFYFDDYTPDSGSSEPAGDKYAMPEGFEGNYYSRALSQSDIEDGQTYLLFNPWGWSFSEFFRYNEENPQTTWGNYPAFRMYSLDDRVPNAYYGETNVNGKPLELVFESADPEDEQAFNIKDAVTGKYLCGVYGEYGSAGGSHNYTIEEMDEPGNPWFVEFMQQDDETYGDFYISTYVGDTWVYLLYNTPTSAAITSTNTWTLRTNNSTWCPFGMLRKTNTDENWHGTAPSLEPEEADYKKVNATDELKAGDKIIIVNEDNLAFANYNTYGGSHYTAEVALDNDNTTYSGWVNGTVDEQLKPYELTLVQAPTEGKFYLVLPTGNYLYPYNWQGEYDGVNYDTYYLASDAVAYGEWTVSVADGVANLSCEIPAIDANDNVHWDEMRTVYLTNVSFNDDGVVSVEFTAREENNHTLSILRKLHEGELLAPVITPQEVAGTYSFEYTDYDYATQTTTVEINVGTDGNLYMTGLFDAAKVQRIPVKLTDDGTISISAYTNGDYEICPADGSAVYFNASLVSLEPVTFKDTSDNAYNYGFAVIYGADYDDYEYLYGDFTLIKISDVTTAVESVENSAAARQYFDLQGRRIQQPRGFVIVKDGGKVRKQLVK